MEQISLDYALKLYNAILDDIINIFAEQFMENIPKSIFQGVIKEGIKYKINLLNALMKDVKIRLNKESLDHINSFFDSVLNAKSGKYDDISRKDEISIIVYCYCIIDTFNYLVRKKSQELFELKEDRYKNFQGFIKDRGLEKNFETIIINFSKEIKKMQDKDNDISITILKAAKTISCNPK